MTAPAAERLLLTGRVQGVGFRPFVYRLARRHGLVGWVRNRSGSVEIHAEGGQAALDLFAAGLLAEAPPLARPALAERGPVAAEAAEAFTILSSTDDARPWIHLPPDHFACADCLRELHDPDDRRHRYPFINCTQCGPRYSIIDRLPYDRANTSMSGFPLCPACLAEYQAPLDRRFHAEPIACPECGPSLHFRLAEAHLHMDLSDTEAALDACVEALRMGLVVAVKGVGGYHLMCDAANDAAVNRMRQAKGRPHKPFAVLVPREGPDDLDAARRLATLEPAAAAMLADPLRPILLAPLRADAGLAAAIAPGLDEVGLMLPYSPLHDLLTRDFGGPLVATSANLSGEPVLTEAAEVESRLTDVAEAFLHHDRPIRRPVDDAVLRLVAGRPRPMRLGRGNAPLELGLPFRLPRPLLAVGAHLRDSVALAWDDRVVISQHLGDMHAPRAYSLFERTVAELQDLYGVDAEGVVCDAHPDYATSRWARQRSGLTVSEVFHHHAHASGLALEHRVESTMLVFTWDGTGYGEDGTLWGGEALYGRPGDWRRVAGLRPFSLPGGDKVSLQPWRTALALHWELGREWQAGHEETELLHKAWQHGLNAPRSGAAGRLFDAAAAMLGLLHNASFEGQAPAWLEAAAQGRGTAVELPLGRNRNGVLLADWAPLLPMLTDASRAAGERAADFHASLAALILAQARAVRAERPFDTVGLTGGVFQNRRLTEAACALLEAEGLRVLLPAEVPCNDAGISYGQIAEAAARMALKPCLAQRR